MYVAETDELERKIVFASPGPSIAERLSNGKALRKRVARQQHALFARSEDGPDPIRIISDQAAQRLTELVPVRHARMLASPFAFFRGGAAIMAADLAGSPSTGIEVQACGDMHVLNFGAFASAERKLVFGINDFDETLPGAWEWDIKRLVASAAIAARHLGGDRVAQEEAARIVVRSYRRRMRKYATESYLRLWYTTITSDEVLDTFTKEARKSARAALRKARTRNHMQVLGKMTDLVDSHHRIVEDQPFVVRETHTETGRPIQEALGLFLDAYRASLAGDRRQLLDRFRVVDVARKVVGVGSVGTRCWVVFLQGASTKDPLFLQVKEAQASVLAPYFPARESIPEGRRVVIGQRLIQGSPDIFLGWGELDGTQFYVRQLRDMKGGADITPGVMKQSTLVEYCGLCGWALALAHAKSGDAAMIAGYVGRSDALDAALGTYALAYADQNDRDYEMMEEAVRKGRIEVSQI